MCITSVLIPDQVSESKQTGAEVRQAQKHLTDIQASYDGTVERLKVCLSV